MSSTMAPVTTGTISTDGFLWGAMPLAWTVGLLGLGWFLLHTRERRPVLVVSLVVLVFASWAEWQRSQFVGPSRFAGNTSPDIYSTITATSDSLNHDMTLTVVVE